MTSTRAATEHYATVLSRHEAATVAWVQKVGERFRFADRPACRVLQPCFLDRATYDQAARAAELVFRGLLTILETKVASAGSAIPPRRRERLADALAKRAFLGGRVDMLPTKNGPKAIEFNPTTPDHPPYGVELSDPLAATFAESDVMREFSATFPCHSISLYERLFDSLVAKHARAGGKGIPNLADIHVPSRSASAAQSASGAPPAELIELIGYLYGRGIGVQLCKHADLAYDGKVLTANGVRIDVAFVSGDPDHLDVCPEDDLLWRAVRDGAVSTACGYPVGSLLYDKGLMADLSDPRTNGVLDPALVASLADIVPWTRRVEDVETTFEGARIDLLDFIRSNRERLVLKPAQGLGGNGLFLGWETSQERWVEALASLRELYVVQERVVGETLHLPYVEGGKRADGDFFYDLNPYVWSEGEAAGCMVRVSQSAVLNLTAGAGSIMPVFILDEPSV